MPLDRITVGVPVFQAWTFVSETLSAIQNQTYRELDVVISVDGQDDQSAEACEPFLSDSRFTLVVQPTKLGWAANVNWLMSRASGEFFCFHPHDDLTGATYFAKLHQEIKERPEVCIAYSDLMVFGDRDERIEQQSLIGDPVTRVKAQIEQFNWLPVHGLVRCSAMRKADAMRVTEFDSCLEDIVWIANIARYGCIRRVPEALYHKRFHANGASYAWFQWPDQRKLDAWIVFGAGLARAAIRAGRNIEERRSLLVAVLDRLLVHRPGRWMFFEAGTLSRQQRLDVVEHMTVRIENERLVDLSSMIGADWRAFATQMLEELPSDVRTEGINETAVIKNI